MLERHLIIADHVFTMAELRARTSNDSVVLPTYRDALSLRVREDEKRKLIFFVYLYCLSMCVLKKKSIKKFNLRRGRE